MRKSVKLLVFLIVFSIGMSIFSGSVNAYYTNMPASVVIGQPDFVSTQYNQCNCLTPTANTIFASFGLNADGKRLFIADNGNSRVLIYNHIPVSNNAPADVSVGQ